MYLIARMMRNRISGRNLQEETGPWREGSKAQKMLIFNIFEIYFFKMWGWGRNEARDERRE